MNTSKSGLAAACVASVLIFAAPAVAGPSHIGVDLEDHVVLRWEAPFGRAARVLARAGRPDAADLIGGEGDHG